MSIISPNRPFQFLLYCLFYDVNAFYFSIILPSKINLALIFVSDDIDGQRLPLSDT